MNQQDRDDLLSRLDERVRQTHESMEELKKTLPELSVRVGKLENWRNYIAGGIAVAGVVGGVMVALVAERGREIWASLSK